MAAARWPPRSEPANSQDFPAQRYAAQGAFGGIVREANTPIVEEEGEGRPAVQQVIEGLGEIIVARQLGTLSLHPRFQVENQREGPILTSGLADLRALTVDLALDVEQASIRCTISCAIGDMTAGFLPCALRRAFASTLAIA